MTEHLSTDEITLLSFFEVEPQTLDPDVPWVYNDSAYETNDGRVHIAFGISPAAEFVTLVLRLDDSLVYQFTADGITDVRHHNDKGRESLEIVVSQRESIWLRLKPHISLTQYCDSRPSQ